MLSLPFLVRPFGIALAVFIVLNLALAIQNPSLSANHIWLYLRIGEPTLSAIASILGAALFVPHSSTSRPWVRTLVGGAIVGFLILVVFNIVDFYLALHRGRVAEAFPVPFSVLIAAVLGSEAVRVIRWRPVRSSLPPPARRFIGLLQVVAAFFLLIFAHIVTFGLTDYSPAAESADAIVVLGAKVNPDGTLSHVLEDRMWTAVRLYMEKPSRYVLLSGGVESNGLSEPQAMAVYAQREGVPREKLILDEGGTDTLASARNCSAIARQRGFRKVLVVSTYFHNARTKMVFERLGTPCLTVPARYRPLVREAFFLFRETVAFPYYFLWYR